MNDLFICECHNIEHQLIFSYNNDWDLVYCDIHLVPEHNTFKRIKNALKYIFGYRSKYGDFDEFIFKKEDVHKLQKIIDHLNAIRE